MSDDNHIIIRALCALVRELDAQHDTLCVEEERRFADQLALIALLKQAPTGPSLVRAAVEQGTAFSPDWAHFLWEEFEFPADERPTPAGRD